MAVENDCTSRESRKRSELGRILVKEEVKARIKLVADILRKDEETRSTEENTILVQSPDAVQEVVKRNQKKTALKERIKEVEDPLSALEEKCVQLVDLIKSSKNVVVYTGAGISTAASIPDYRGPNGVWTLLQQGKAIESCNLSEAEPTFTHMALAQMHRKKIISHVVSQNCDGLHLRSGLSRTALSEVHGNMFIEVCKGCTPAREYIRLFDVTERTSFRKHKTGRKCHKCGHELTDTIVHFGERGTLKSPLNWTKAIAVAKKCDLIVCLGSSLKVLRKYACLWGLDRPAQDRPKLCIVNLQWTPKDHHATLKINGQCDSVIKLIVNSLQLSVPLYNREQDPLFRLATRLNASEMHSTTKSEVKLLSEIASCGTDDNAIDVSKHESARPTYGAASSQTESDSPNVYSSFRECDRSIIDGSGGETVAVKIAESQANTSVDNGLPEVPNRKRGRPKKNVTGREEDDLIGAVKSSNQNPGWFGKGCRKPIKYKKC